MSNSFVLLDKKWTCDKSEHKQFVDLVQDHAHHDPDSGYRNDEFYAEKIPNVRAVVLFPHPDNCSIKLAITATNHYIDSFKDLTVLGGTFVGTSCKEIGDNIFRAISSRSPNGNNVDVIYDIESRYFNNNLIRCCLIAPLPFCEEGIIICDVKSTDRYNSRSSTTCMNPYQVIYNLLISEAFDECYKSVLEMSATDINRASSDACELLIADHFGLYED